AMARRMAAPRCLELRCCSRLAGAFWTTSSPSVRISSMWQGWFKKGLICSCQLVGFDMASCHRMKTYTAVGTVGASAALGSLVDLYALDDQVAGVEALAVSVGLGVLQKVEEEASGLLGPAGLADTPVVACCRQRVVHPLFQSVHIHQCTLIIEPIRMQ